ncbi:hypothetical protein M408DRAFT_261453 [Serendipita vermifera MAFF 305830]|uniref:Zn(2)-C6 fungal-type domain-containing protein n=1 Tax=Serendipita vermifera MAFF 305830 TaxID=933852 RepID=A0A0C3BHA7_SERVB|nr:hypothetical protein M408DRAFT_261453 [Serendipita vermifera MAFF 305830]
MAAVCPKTAFPEGASHVERSTKKVDTTSVIACRQCRLRKVRCDSNRPTCKNCTRRSDACLYDPAPKRRGPDKRSRACHNLQSKTPEEATRLRKQRRTTGRLGRNTLPALDDLQAQGIVENASLTTLVENQNSFLAFSPSSSVPMLGNAYTEDGFLPSDTHILYGPSCSFQRQTWWDNLLSIYSQDRAEASLKIYKDLDVLLNDNLYWISFIEFRRLVDNLFDPMARAMMQPSVILAALALSTMMKSSEIGLGEEGRTFALWLRDAAQSSLEASISASWIDPGIAQAAFLLALFEATCHPLHSAARIGSSLFLLDSIIQALSLTKVDAHDPTVTTFLAAKVPRVGFSAAPTEREEVIPIGFASRMCSCENNTRLSRSRFPRNSLGHLFDTMRRTFFVEDRFLLEGISELRLDWPDPIHIVDIEKEESRRLCWNTMIFITALREFTHLNHRLSTWDFQVTKPENFAILFPGEQGCKSHPKDSIWALHCRGALLWNFTQKLANRPHLDSIGDSEMARDTWKEADIIEEALGKHACSRGDEGGRKYF